MSRVAERPVSGATAEPETVQRYSFFDRVLHWTTTLAFLYLFLSGLALGYPRMAWLYDILGGGQTVRYLHPIIGVVFTVGVVVMLVVWFREMLFREPDGLWVRRVGRYAREGHVGLDVGKYNAGQKGYFWWALITGVLLLLTGIPLWFPHRWVAEVEQVARLAHHALFLLAVAGAIVHTFMSTVLLPGTMRSMTTGKVTRAWAAWHHPRWFRDQERSAEESDAAEPTRE